jgi:hypothetical protein
VSNALMPASLGYKKTRLNLSVGAWMGLVRSNFPEQRPFTGAPLAAADSPTQTMSSRQAGRRSRMNGQLIAIRQASPNTDYGANNDS